MSTEFETQNGKLILDENGVEIRYRKYLKAYLALLLVAYLLWSPLNILSYIKRGDTTDLTMGLLIALCLFTTLYQILSLSANRQIPFKDIRRVEFRKGLIIDRVKVIVTLNSSKKKSIYLDFNEYVLRGIESSFKEKGVDTKMNV